MKLYHVPTSSASSERVWSFFNFVHSLKRNQLRNSKVIKLVYIYFNAALLDTQDNFGYLTASLADDLEAVEEEEEAIGIFDVSENEDYTRLCC